MPQVPPFDERYNAALVERQESPTNPTIKFAFFAEGKQNDVVEALHRAAEQLNSRKMKSYNSPVSTPAVIRWFRQ